MDVMFFGQSGDSELERGCLRVALIPFRVCALNASLQAAYPEPGHEDGSASATLSWASLYWYGKVDGDWYVSFEDVMNKVFSDVRNGVDAKQTLERAQDQLKSLFSRMRWTGGCPSVEANRLKRRRVSDVSRGLRIAPSMEITARWWQLAEEARHIGKVLRDKVPYFTFALPYTKHPE
jgi:hypothetical protein